MSPIWFRDEDCVNVASLQWAGPGGPRPVGMGRELELVYDAAGNFEVGGTVAGLASRLWAIRRAGPDCET